MEEKEAGDQGGLELVVAVGLTGGRKSKYILNWALDKFLPESSGNLSIRILHVYPKITSVPTPMGNWLPIAQVREDVVAGFRQEIEWKKKKNLLPFQQALKAKRIKSEIVMLESDDIPMAISLEIEKYSIRHLVVGLTSTSLFSRKNLSLRKMLGENLNISTTVTETTPDFCSVYVIADGRLQHMRPADSEPTVINVEQPSGLSKVSSSSSQSSYSLTIGGLLLKSTSSSPTYTPTASSDCLKITGSHRQPESLPVSRSVSKRTPQEANVLKNHTFFDTKANENATNSSFASQGSSSSGSWASDRTSPLGSFVSTPPTSSFVSTAPNGSFASTPPSGSFVGTPPARSSVGTPPSTSFVGTPPMGSFVGTPPSHKSPGGSASGASTSQASQLEKLRMELRHIEQMYELAQNSDINEKLNDLSKQRMEEAIEIKEEKAKELASKATQNGVSDSGVNAPQSRAETKPGDKDQVKQSPSGPISLYQKFTWGDIVEATSSFSEEFKIGMGAFGTVYKCKLHHTTVAVKVLHSKDSATNKQFLQELEILSSIRHPHLLLLLGAVPDESCLVYEYMENGSLDDRLFRKDNKAPLPWYERFRICWEVASALAFLHSTKPNPIIHRDLKPANILLDQNLVSKIGDAGLGTMIKMEPSSVSIKTLYKETSPVGTLCYIDPEYQRTGRVSTKSDIYALGVVILQLLTAKPAVGIAYTVEDAIDEGNLIEVLDQEAGQWPEKETLELALLGLQCAELRGRDRPDLREKVLPALERLKEIADSAKESASSSSMAMPIHFICPILKDIMEDPYVAADGYTYDRKAIEQWLTENDTSPTTNLPLPHKFIMPNYTLLEAIKQWKAKNPIK